MKYGRELGIVVPSFFFFKKKIEYFFFKKMNILKFEYLIYCLQGRQISVDTLFSSPQHAPQPHHQGLTQPPDSRAFARPYL